MYCWPSCSNTLTGAFMPAPVWNCQRRRPFDASSAVSRASRATIAGRSTLRAHLRLALLAKAVLLVALPASAATYEVVEGRIRRDGQVIQLFGVNWFGAETQDHVVHGLWSRGYGEMIEQIAALGFNAVRLPGASDMTFFHGRWHDEVVRTAVGWRIRELRLEVVR